jgi:hypothetical protein
LLLGCCAIAQDSAPEKPPSPQKPIMQSYPASHFGFPEKGDTRRFLFTLNELDNGRKINTRTVEVLAREGQSNDLKTGSRIAVPNGPAGSFQYMEVGLNLHLRYALRDDKSLDLFVTLEMSSLATEPKPDVHSQLPPRLRQIKSEVSSIIAPDQPTVLSTVEDVDSGHLFQLVVTTKAR